MAFARSRVRVGEPFPSDAEILEIAPTHHRIGCVQATLLALEARGLIERQETRWSRAGGRIVARWALIEQ